MSVANRVHERDEDVKSRLQRGGELSQAFDYPGLLLGNDAGNPRYQNDGEDGHYESNDDVWHWGSFPGSGPYVKQQPFHSFNHTTLATNQRRFSYVSRAPGAAAHFRLAETGHRHVVDGQGLLADHGVDDPGDAQAELPHCPRPDEEERGQREGGEGQKLN